MSKRTDLQAYVIELQDQIERLKHEVQVFRRMADQNKRFSDLCMRSIEIQKGSFEILDQRRILEIEDLKEQLEEALATESEIKPEAKGDDLDETEILSKETLKGKPAAVDFDKAGLNREIDIMLVDSGLYPAKRRGRPRRRAGK